MTLLGVGPGFQLGSSDPPTINMSLDELIASRQKEQQQGRRTTRAKSQGSASIMNDPNQISTVDRSIATSRAKRNAKLRARRGLSDTKKASAMEIEQEIQKQGRATLLAKNIEKKRVSFGSRKPDAAERAEIRKERRRLARAAAKAKRDELAARGGAGGVATTITKLPPVAETAPLGRPPSKRQVKAAVHAMEDKGFKIPDGYQMVISFAPVENAVLAPAARKSGDNHSKNNNKQQRGGGKK